MEEQQEYKVKTLLQIEDDILDLYEFYAEIAGEKSAERFRGAIDEILSSLSFWPRSHRIFEDDETIRRVDMVKHKVAIVYKIVDSKLEVIAVRAFHSLKDSNFIHKLINDRLLTAGTE